MAEQLPPHLPLLAALVDELARSGVRHAVLCPGSRNAPLLLALEAEPQITCWPVLDERAAGFLALGIAKATGQPAAICVTSGTALSNLLPAVTEAHEAGVPLLVLSADRPHELRDVGAGQTIDQLRVLDHVSRWTLELDLYDATNARERWLRATAGRAVHAALATAGGRPGPVQLNVPLRKPLTAPGPHAPLTGGRPDGQPWLAVTPSAAVPGQAALDELARTLLTTRRGVLIAGRSERSPAVSRWLPRLAASLGWPLLADPMSGARRGAQAIAGYDLLLAGDGTTSLAPELILRAGDLPVSQPLRDWLAGAAAGARQLLLTPEAVWSDPDAVASDWFTGDPSAVLTLLISAVNRAREDSSDDPATEPGWLDSWRDAERGAIAGTDADGAIADDATLTEPLVARLLAETLTSDDALVVGASLPIRMIERWAPARDEPPRVLSNRGANGIDGVVSTTFGVAAAMAPGAGRTFAHIGELTLLYDQGGLAAARLGLPVQFVVVDNGGGRIFDRLPVAKDADPGAFDRVIRTPHSTDLSALAAAHAIEHHAPATAGELRALLALPADRARLILVTT